MLSSSLDIVEFVEKVKDRSFHEIIWMTDQEATEAERCKFQLKSDGQRDEFERYARCLKDFILYMRHGVRTSSLRNLQLDMFNPADSH